MPRRDVFSPHCSSPCKPTTAHLKTPLSHLKTPLIGLIQDGDESAYRQEVKELAVWCSLNNLELNTLKTVEMTVDFRRNPPAHPPLTIMNSTVAAVESFRFLGSIISQDLKWDTHIDSNVKKAQQKLYFLRQLRKFNLPQELLKQFYSAVIKSVLCTGLDWDKKIGPCIFWSLLSIYLSISLYLSIYLSIYVCMYIYIYIWYTLPVKRFWTVGFLMFFKVSSAHQACIYLIQNTAK